MGKAWGKARIGRDGMMNKGGWGKKRMRKEWRLGEGEGVTENGEAGEEYGELVKVKAADKGWWRRLAAAPLGGLCRACRGY